MSEEQHVEVKPRIGLVKIAATVFVILVMGFGVWYALLPNKMNRAYYCQHFGCMCTDSKSLLIIEANTLYACNWAHKIKRNIGEIKAVDNGYVLSSAFGEEPFIINGLYIEIQGMESRAYVWPFRFKDGIEELKSWRVE